MNSASCMEWICLAATNRVFPDFNSEKQALLCFVNQLTIFKSIMNRVDSILNDIEVSLYSALEDSEIEVAKKLAKVNLRAAGALLGVIIEGHLQKVATSHGVVIGERNPTIADLNDPLKAASVIDLSTYPRGGESPTSQICATFAATRRTANPQPAT